MKQVFIPEKVVFYIEADEQVGTIHDLNNRPQSFCTLGPCGFT